MGRFVRFTRLDGANTPIWINAAFVVTVEPRKGGGSLVVPMGDGMDYEVRETPEAVLKSLEGSEVPEVLAVPAPTGLTKMPDDVSPETLPGSGDAPAPESDNVDKPKPAKRTAAKKASARKESSAKDREDGKSPAAKKRSRAKTAEKAAGSVDPFVAEAVEYVIARKPSSKKKIENTLKNKYRDKDEAAIGAVLAELEKKAVVAFHADGHAVYGDEGRSHA